MPEASSRSKRRRSDNQTDDGSFQLEKDSSDNRDSNILENDTQVFSFASIVSSQKNSPPNIRESVSITRPLTLLEENTNPQSVKSSNSSNWTQRNGHRRNVVIGTDTSHGVDYAAPRLSYIYASRLHTQMTSERVLRLISSIAPEAKVEKLSFEKLDIRFFSLSR